MPPWARSSERVSWTNRSKARSAGRGHADAMVAHAHDRLAVLDRHARPRSRRRAPSTSRRCSAGCRTPGRDAPDRRRRRSGACRRHRQPLALLGHDRLAHLDGPLQDRSRGRAARGAARSSPGSRARRRAGRRAAVSCAATWRSITARRRADVSASSAARRRTSTAVRMGAIGLRSSCDSIARNSSLRRSASFSSSSARARSRSSSRRCVLSVMTATQPSTAPSASKVGETAKCIQRRPSAG